MPRFNYKKSPRINLREDAPTNAVGGGAIAGLGVGPDGEPGVNKKKKRRPDMGLVRRWIKNAK